MAEALAHPVRGKLLTALSEKNEEGASIRQVAERTGETNRAVRYHFDAMIGTGLIEIVAKKRKRGVVERFFRARQVPEIPAGSEAEIDADVRQQIAIEFLKILFADVTGAMRTGKLGARPDTPLIRVACPVDECGWRELVGMHSSYLRDVKAVLGKSRQRMEASGETPLQATTALLLFEVPHWPSS